MTINQGQVSYHKNSLVNNTPEPARPEEGGFEHYQEKVEGRKVRNRSDSFKDHFSQATLFWNSMSEPEKEHIKQAFSFELGKLSSQSVQQQVVDMFANVSLELAQTVAKNVGVKVPESGGSNVTKSSPALSQENTTKVPDTRKVGVIVGEGYKGSEVKDVIKALEEANMHPEIISHQLGTIKGSDGEELEADHTFLTGESVLFDALYLVGRPQMDQDFEQYALYFAKEAFAHYKPIGGTHDGIKLLKKVDIDNAAGVITNDDLMTFTKDFIVAIAEHRHWNREMV